MKPIFNPYKELDIWATHSRFKNYSLMMMTIKANKMKQVWVHIALSFIWQFQIGKCFQKLFSHIWQLHVKNCCQRWFSPFPSEKVTREGRIGHRKKASLWLSFCFHLVAFYLCEIWGYQTRVLILLFCLFFSCCCGSTRLETNEGPKNFSL